VRGWRLTPNSWGIRNGWWLALLFAAVGAGLLFAVSQTAPPSTFVHVVPTFDHPSDRLAEGHLGGLGIAGNIVGVVASALAFGVFVLWATRNSARSSRGRIEALTRSLTEAMNVIDTINHEVLQGQQALDALNAQVSAQKELANMTAEQAAAVRALVSSEVGRVRLGGVAVQVAIGVAGVGLGLLVSHLWLH